MVQLDNPSELSKECASETGTTAGGGGGDGSDPGYSNASRCIRFTLRSS